MTRRVVSLAVILNMLPVFGKIVAFSGVAEAATLAINPSTSMTMVGQNFNVAIEVQAGIQLIDVASAHINFDPAILQVVTVTAGSSLPVPIQNTFDNTAGTLDYSASTSSNFPTGTFTVATVVFTSLEISTGASLTFNTSVPRLSDITFGGASVLTSVQNGTVVVSGTTGTVTPTPSNTPTNTQTNTPTGGTPTNSVTGTPTAMPTNTQTDTPTGGTPTNSVTGTPTATPTNTQTDTPTGGTPTNSVTGTPTATPTNTQTNTPTGGTPTNSVTGTPTATPTNTQTDTPTGGTPTNSVTGTPTATPTNTQTNTPTGGTPTNSVTGTPTATPTNTQTNTPTGGTPTNSVTGTPTATPTNTQTNTPTGGTPTNSVTGTPTATPTNTQTNTPTLTATSTPTLTPTNTPVRILVCDAVPSTGSDPGQFGDGRILNNDVVALFKASLGVNAPPTGSALFTAMDAAPLDNPPMCGGNTNLLNNDVVDCFKVSLGVGSSFVRTISGSTCTSALGQ